MDAANRNGLNLLMVYSLNGSFYIYRDFQTKSLVGNRSTAKHRISMYKKLNFQGIEVTIKYYHANEDFSASGDIKSPENPV